MANNRWSTLLVHPGQTDRANSNETTKSKLLQHMALCIPPCPNTLPRHARTFPASAKRTWHGVVMP